LLAGNNQHVVVRARRNDGTDHYFVVAKYSNMIYIVDAYAASVPGLEKYGITNQPSEYLNNVVKDIKRLEVCTVDFFSTPG
jgi:hypothetical protein